MKYILTEEQYRRLNKSSQSISNFIVKYITQYIGNGNGEGLGLSHVLDKNKVELVKFNKMLFANTKENKKII
jgi:hypothetical protein